MSSSEIPFDYPKFPPKLATLRNGGIINIDLVEKLLLKSTTTTIDIPEGDLIITNVSGTKLFDLVVYRAYFEYNKINYFLQFNTNVAGDVLDVLLFQSLGKIYPDTPAAWDEWLNPNHGHLHNRYLISPNGIEYTREWGEGETHTPTKFSEIQFSHPTSEGRKIIYQQIQLFARPIGDDKVEYILLTLDESDSNIHPYVGVMFNPTAVKIF